MKYLTKDKDDLNVIENYTDAGQTVELADGSYGFADGRGAAHRNAVVMIPGYDYVYGLAAASAEATNVHQALESQAPFPQGSKIYYRDKV